MSEPPMWTCTTCNRMMQEGNREAHIRGRAHALRARQVTNTSNEAPQIPPGPSSKTREMWTCTSCNRSMNKENKPSHLRGKPHALLAGRAVSASNATPQTPPENPESPLRAAIPQNQDLPPLLKSRAKPPKPPKPPESHPNGEKYIKIKDVAKLHKHVCEIPAHCYEVTGAYRGQWRGWHTFVSKRDIERASDQWDGEGVIEDIDTAFGLLPHGGAYSDSFDYY